MFTGSHEKVSCYNTGATSLHCRTLREGREVSAHERIDLGHGTNQADYFSTKTWTHCCSEVAQAKPSRDHVPSVCLTLLSGQLLGVLAAETANLSHSSASCTYFTPFSPGPGCFCRATPLHGSPEPLELAQGGETFLRCPHRRPEEAEDNSLIKGN